MTTKNASNWAPFEACLTEQRQWIERCNTLLQQSKTTSTNFGSADHLVRRLTNLERDTLIQVCHCQCSDWSQVQILVASSQDVSHHLAKQVSRTRFSGWVLLGVDLNENNVSVQEDKKNDHDFLPWGVHKNGVVRNCILEPGCRVYDNAVVSNTFIATNASVVQCGSISTSGDKNDDALEVEVGPETGGSRPITVTIRSTIIDVCDSLRGIPTNRPCCLDAVSRSMNIVASHAKIVSTQLVLNVSLATHARIEGAAHVSDCTLLEGAQISTGSVVKKALLQWNASVVGNSSVSNVLLMEESSIGPNSFVSETIVGPDSHLSAGEVHASILGPNSNAHHQSLLIGVLWPLGRGNVGYGANVGSNHTGRLPDQELLAGEGVFFGLSASIKFPLNIGNSPYTIVASGVTLPPQNVTMPFSLLLMDDNGKNVILPGWVLTSSPYTVVRSEAKYKNRRKAKRHDFYTGWSMIRPGTIDLCWKARLVLQSKQKSPHIGSNLLSENSRKAGIIAYTDTIQRYALSGLFHRIIELQQKMPICSQWISKLFKEIWEAPDYLMGGEASTSSEVTWPVMPWEEGNDSWKHECAIIRQEFLAVSVPKSHKEKVDGLRSLLVRFRELESSHAQKVFKSKKRDDLRGTATIPGYAQAHVLAEDDPVVKSTREMSRHMDSRIQKILTDLDEGQRSRL
eukprot:scaffold21210_cov53-Attheya_sp.AAC.1